eukprot:SM000155S01671  [mRNA]  locus=s155:324715:325639:+ [translate_table: standard]
MHRRAVFRTQSRAALLDAEARRLRAQLDDERERLLDLGRRRREAERAKRAVVAAQVWQPQAVRTALQRQMEQNPVSSGAALNALRMDLAVSREQLRQLTSRLACPRQPFWSLPLVQHFLSCFGHLSTAPWLTALGAAMQARVEKDSVGARAELAGLTFNPAAKADAASPLQAPPPPALLPAAHEVEHRKKRWRESPGCKKGPVAIAVGALHDASSSWHSP